VSVPSLYVHMQLSHLRKIVYITKYTYMFSKYVIQMRSSLHWPYALCIKLHPLGHVVTLSYICGDRRFVIS